MTFPFATFWALNPHLDVCYLTVNFWCAWEGEGVGNMTARAEKGYTSPRSQTLEPTKPQATLWIGLHCRVVLISAEGRLCLQFLLSNTRWSDWLNVATKLTGGAVAPGPTLNIAITLSLEERLVGAGRACAESSFRSSRPLSRPSLSSLHWEQVRPWALAPAMRRARARNTPPRTSPLRPLPCILPPWSSRPPLFLVFPRLRAAPSACR